MPLSLYSVINHKDSSSCSFHQWQESSQSDWLEIMSPSSPLMSYIRISLFIKFFLSSSICNGTVESEGTTRQQCISLIPWTIFTRRNEVYRAAKVPPKDNAPAVGRRKNGRGSIGRYTCSFSFHVVFRFLTQHDPRQHCWDYGWYDCYWIMTSRLPLYLSNRSTDCFWRCY